MNEKISTSEPQSINTPKLSIPILVTIIIVFIVIVFTGILFFFLGKAQNKNIRTINRPTMIPTATTQQDVSWKTYTNAKYNYTIDYPGDWDVKEFADSQYGASFNDAVTISAGKTLLNYVNLSLEEYAKIAGSEVENRNSLASYKKITTTNGIVGYKTTWMVQGKTINGRPSTSGESESLPITYFEIPGNKTYLIRVTLDKEEDMAIYEKMLTTVKISTPLTPEPTVDEVSVLKNVIKKYISLKHRSNESSLTITVSKIEGNYAKGGVSDGSGGGMWFASKEEGAWMLVWDGNGTIDCSVFTLHPNFSTSIIPECYDSIKQDIVKR